MNWIWGNSNKLLINWGSILLMRSGDLGGLSDFLGFKFKN